MSRRSSPCRFTLIELLVVIAIIAILVAMLLPAITQAKKTALSIQCMSNQHQVSLSLLQYADDYQGWIPSVYVYNSIGHMVPYGVMICKVTSRWGAPDAGVYLQNGAAMYCPSQNPAEKFDWTASFNSTWATLGIVGCANSGSWNGYPWTDWTYIITSGWDRWLNLYKCPKPVSFPYVGDTVMNSGSKSQYSYWQPDTSYSHINVHTRHNNGANFAFVDGHVNNVKENELPEYNIRYYCTQKYIEKVLP